MLIEKSIDLNGFHSQFSHAHTNYLQQKNLEVSEQKNSGKKSQVKHSASVYAVILGNILSQESKDQNQKNTKFTKVNQRTALQLCTKM